MDMKWIAVMVVGFIAAMVGMKKQKLGIGWGQPLAIVGAIIAVGGAVMNLSGFMGSKGKQMDAEMRYIRLQGQFLAEEVKNAANPSKVYVSATPTTSLTRTATRRSATIRCSTASRPVSAASRSCPSTRRSRFPPPRQLLLGSPPRCPPASRSS